MTLFESQAISVGTITENPAPRPKKHGWLPLLTILFLISYGLMTMLIVEQGSTIESQRALIHELFRDSQELTAAKLKAQQLEHASSARTQAQAQTPSTRIPSAQAPASKAPSSQAGPQDRTVNKAQKPQLKMPAKPTSELVDVRTLNTI